MEVGTVVSAVCFRWSIKEDALPLVDTVTPDAPTVDAPSGLLINGEWHETTRVITVVDPATEWAVGRVADASTSDALRALDAASAAQEDWAALSAFDRAKLFRLAEDNLVAQRDRIARAVVLESGKPLAQAEAEVDAAITYWRWNGSQIGHLHGQSAASSDGTFRVLTARKPVGPALLISPWNFPALTPLRKMSAALAAGCTIIVKSASLTPLTSAIMVETVEAAGFPPGVINLLHTSDSAGLTGALMADPRIRKVSFTGSTAVGVSLLHQAATNVASSSMELGGNGAFIVLRDADIPSTVQQAVAAKFRNSGQVCVAVNRFILEDDIADQFIDEFVRQTAALTVGHGLDPGIGMGPLITKAQRDRVVEWLARSVAAGSRILLGGNPLDRPGYFLEPTVIEASGLDDPFAQEEIFGPVAVMYRVGSSAEAIEFANRTPYGLAAYVFTADVGLGLTVAGALDSGVVGVNRVGVTEPAAPFGGVKASGLGREGGEGAILEFMEEQYVALARAEI